MEIESRLERLISQENKGPDTPVSDTTEGGAQKGKQGVKFLFS